LLNHSPHPNGSGFWIQSIAHDYRCGPGSRVQTRELDPVYTRDRRHALQEWCFTDLLEQLVQI
jgi:hypothetical protein